MLTPAIRAIRPLPLTLLVTGIRADHQHVAVPADHAALFTHRLDAGTDLHSSLLGRCRVGQPWARAGAYPRPGKRELYHPEPTVRAGWRDVRTRGPLAVIATVCSQ